MMYDFIGDARNIVRSNAEFMSGKIDSAVLLSADAGYLSRVVQYDINSVAEWSNV